MGGTHLWVRGQGAAVAKAVWWHKYYNLPKIEISWSGMTQAEKADIAIWLKERAERLAERKKIEKEEYDKRNGKFTPRDGGKMGMLEYYRSLMACRADCGQQNPELCCSKCKSARKSYLFFFSSLVTDNTSYRLLQCILSIGRLEGASIYLRVFGFSLSILVSQNVLWDGKAHSRRIPPAALSRTCHDALTSSTNHKSCENTLDHPSASCLLRYFRP
jgi:hypothetical protein